MRKNWRLIGATIAFAIWLLVPPRMEMPVRAQQPTGRIDPVLLDVLATGAPNQLIEAVVTFNQSPSVSDLANVAVTGVQVLRFNALPMVGVRGTAAQIGQLFGLPGLRSIYYNRRLAYSLNQTVPLIGADRVWADFGMTGGTVGVAIIDTGIDGTHPDLPFGHKVIQNVKVTPDVWPTGPIFVENVPNTDTTSGHGTHVASIVAGTGAALAGKYTGVAFGANLVGLGTGEALVILTSLEAYDWVLTHAGQYGIRVISNSWGTVGPFSPDHPINVASKRAYDAGLVNVFAAMNDGPATNTLNAFCAPWVICVAAGLKDGQTLADFSSRGVPGDPLQRPTITAPGVSVSAARAISGVVITGFGVDPYSHGTDDIHYASANGTSMATPHVSGTVALMLHANPALSPDQIKSMLEETATAMPNYGQHEVGAGYLNAYQAVARVLAIP